MQHTRALVNDLYYTILQYQFSQRRGNIAKQEPVSRDFC
jgi:hypothetical protein